MIEIPESKVFASRAENILRGKVVVDVINATNPHRFAWYHGDPLLYSSILVGRKVEEVKGFGCYIDICFDHDTHLAISDGTNMKYFQKALFVGKVCQPIVIRNILSFYRISLMQRYLQI